MCIRKVMNMYLMEDDVIGIQMMSEKYKHSYYEMSKSRALFSPLYDDMFEKIWGKLQEEEWVLFVAQIKSTQEICAFCSLNNTNKKIPEFGLDVLDGYMGMGFGKRTAKLVLDYASKWKDVEYFVWEADADNIKSIKIAEYLGGTLIQNKTFLPEDIIEFGKGENILTDEDITLVKKYRIEKVN